jgi:hypothetical protein
MSGCAFNTVDGRPREREGGREERKEAGGGREGEGVGEGGRGREDREEKSMRSEYEEAGMH